jgi:hypothetical protein
MQRAAAARKKEATKERARAHTCDSDRDGGVALSGHERLRKTKGAAGGPRGRPNN